jgi:murein L,D-transpeptidase YcbB/YkuD
VVVDSHHYNHLDHGYAATIHKSQGATVDRTFVLATPHFDRHSTYVALSRHRESATVFYGEDDFTPDWSRRSAAENFAAVLSRARPKDLATDRLHRGISLESTESDGMRPDISDDTHERTLSESAPAQPAPTQWVQQTRREAVAAWRSDRAAQRAAAEAAQAHDASHDHGLEL